MQHILYIEEPQNRVPSAVCCSVVVEQEDVSGLNFTSHFLQVQETDYLGRAELCHLPFSSSHTCFLTSVKMASSEPHF